MTPTAKGAFCKACNKEVTDFSNYSTHELITYFTTYTGGSTCGRFKTSQLGTYTITVNPRVLRWKIPLWKKILAVLIICFGNMLFNGSAAYSQVADTAVHAAAGTAKDTATSDMSLFATQIPGNPFGREVIYRAGPVLPSYYYHPAIFNQFEQRGKKVRQVTFTFPTNGKKKPAPVRRKKLPFTKPKA